MPVAVVIATLGAYVCIAVPQTTSIVSVLSVIGVAAALSSARKGG